MSYLEFLKHCDLSDPYKAMGYSDPRVAQLRYETIIQHLASYENLETIGDAGCGLCLMWDYFLSKGVISDLKSRGLNSVILLENCDVYLETAQTKAKTLTDKTEINFNVVNKSFLHFYKSVDVMISVGALNYYDPLTLSQILSNLLDHSKQGFIFETNLQTPHTSIGEGIWNPSIDQIYQLIYSKLLYQGDCQVNATFYKKWTSTWNVIKFRSA